MDASRLQIWAIDVSAYSLWTQGSRSDEIVSRCLSSEEERAKVRRYLREVDQIRCLAGKLVARLAIVTHRADIHWDEISFQVSKEGKPYLARPTIDFDFNITHDGDWVALAYRGSFQTAAERSSPQLGVDVMEIHLPHYEKSVRDFVDTMNMTITARERQWILEREDTDTFVTPNGPPAGLGRDEFAQLKKLYTLWTYKEAYTKARGLGLGYDFQNVEIIKGEGDFRLFATEEEETGLDLYQAVLPRGQSRSGRAGTGTGMDSLLVAMQRSVEGQSKPPPAVKIQRAQEGDNLRLWTMQGLVDAAMDVISKR